MKDITTYRREYMREYRKKHPERIKQHQRNSYLRHRDSRLERQREQYARNKWPRHLELKYGVAREQFETLLAKQGGRCAICRTDEPGGRGNRFHVDHCHKTGAVRGLLCTSCNHLLGNARDRAEVLREAARYLTMPSPLA